MHTHTQIQTYAFKHKYTHTYTQATLVLSQKSIFSKKFILFFLHLRIATISPILHYFYISAYNIFYYFLLYREFNARGDLHAGTNIAVRTAQIACYDVMWCDVIQSMCTFILIFIFKFVITFIFLFKFIFLFLDAHIHLNSFSWCILLNICSIILRSFLRHFWKSRMWCWRTDPCKFKTVNMHRRKFILCILKNKNAIFNSENGIYDGLDWNGMR